MASKQRRQIKSGARQKMAARIEDGRRELVAAANRHAKRVKGEFEQAVADWTPQNRPQFTADVTVAAKEIVVTVRPYKNRHSSDIFRYVDQGTKPHVIRPVKAKRLRFQWGGPGSYRPKTAPAKAPKRLAGGQEVETVYALEVHHPGNEPRHISRRIQRETYDEFRREIENAFKRIQRRK